MRIEAIANVPAIPWAAWVCKKIRPRGGNSVLFLIISDVTFSWVGEVITVFVGATEVGTILPFRVGDSDEVLILFIGIYNKGKSSYS